MFGYDVIINLTSSRLTQHNKININLKYIFGVSKQGKALYY
jgi:hypothetical protein